MQVLAATGTVLAFWLVVGAACLGWGVVLLRTLIREPSVRPEAAGLFWAGFALLIGLLQIWHLFLPVDWRATVLLLGGGIAAGFISGVFRSLFTQPASPAQAVFFLLAAFWLAYRGLDFPRIFDSGGYHFSTIRWINEFAAVPGLANLQDRLGFNQSYFLFIALLNVHPFFGEGYHVANSLLGFVLVASLLATALATLRSERPASVAAFLQCGLLPVVLAQSLRPDISCPTPDFPVFVVGLACFVLLVRLAEEAAEANFAQSASPAILTVLLAAGCTLKLSFLIFALVVIGLLLHQIWRRNVSRSSFGVRWLAWLLTGSVLFWGVPFAAHGIILSGYPVFPSTVLAWPGDWRVPQAAAEECANWIRSWARTPGLRPEKVLGSWAWLGPWWQRTRLMPGFCLPLLITGVSSLLLAVIELRARTHQNQLARWLVLLAPIGAGLLFWFLSAPDPRFADWLLWLLAAWSGACALSLIQGTGKIFGPRILAIATLCAGLGVILLGIPAWLHPRDYGFESLPEVTLREYFTRSGLKVYLPINQRDNRIWDAPLPSAPQPHPDLTLRGSSLREGFRTTPLLPAKKE